MYVLVRGIDFVHSLFPLQFSLTFKYNFFIVFSSCVGSVVLLVFILLYYCD
jgi:hypothetical protein